MIIWLCVPPKKESLWKKVGPWGRGGPKQTPAPDPKPDDAGETPATT